MTKNIFLLITCFLFYNSAMSQTTIVDKNNSVDKGNDALACKLTSKELQARKATVLESLRKQVIEKKELASGYSYKFDNSDKMLDELTEFIKTERQCCDFFDFALSIISDEGTIWLSLTGPKNAKEFIKTELNL